MNLGPQSAENAWQTELELMEAARKVEQLAGDDAVAAEPKAREMLAVAEFKDWEQGELVVLLALTRALIDSGEHSEVCQYATRARRLAVRYNDLSSEASALSHLLMFTLTTGQTNYQDDYFDRLNQIIECKIEERDLAAALNSMAGIFCYRGDYKKAIEFLQRAIVIRKNLGDLSGGAGIAINLGNLLSEQGRSAEAIVCLRDALTCLRSKAVNSKRIGGMLLHLGLAFERIKRYDAALDYFLTAEKHLKESNSRDLEEYSRVAIATILQKVGRPYEAIEIIESEELIKSNNLRTCVFALTALGNALIDVRDNKGAQIILEKSLEVVNTIGDSVVRLQPLISLARLELQRDPNRALGLAQDTLQFAEQAGLLEEESNATEVISLAYAALEDYQQAYTWLARHRQANSTFTRELERQRFEVAAAEAEVQRVQLEAELHQKALVQARQEVAELQEHLERRVVQRTVELVEANTELRTMAWSLAHYLRNPLQVITGFTDLLVTVDAHDEQSETFARYTNEAAWRISDILDGLLRFSERTREDLTRETLDLGSVVRSAWEDVGGPESGADFSLGELPLVSGDATALRVAFGNLLHNALKYSRGVGRPQIRVAHYGQHDLHVIQVHDNGVGFDSAQTGRLFQAFARLHPSTEFAGVGLGLADVKRIVLKHGGHVWAEGRPGLGATFSVALPHRST